MNYSRFILSMQFRLIIFEAGSEKAVPYHFSSRLLEQFALIKRLLKRVCSIKRAKVTTFYDTHIVKLGCEFLVCHTLKCWTKTGFSLYYFSMRGQSTLMITCHHKILSTAVYQPEKIFFLELVSELQSQSKLDSLSFCYREQCVYCEDLQVHCQSPRIYLQKLDKMVNSGRNLGSSLRSSTKRGGNELLHNFPNNGCNRALEMKTLPETWNRWDSASIRR